MELIFLVFIVKISSNINFYLFCKLKFMITIEYKITVITIKNETQSFLFFYSCKKYKNNFKQFLSKITSIIYKMSTKCRCLPTTI